MLVQETMNNYGVVVLPLAIEVSAGGGNRTHMALRPRALEARASTVPPLQL